MLQVKFCSSSLKIENILCNATHTLSFYSPYVFDPQENTNIEDAAHCLVEHILNNEDSPFLEREPTSLVLSGYNGTTREPFNCSSCPKW